MRQYFLRNKTSLLPTFTEYVILTVEIPSELTHAACSMDVPGYGGRNGGPNNGDGGVTASARAASAIKLPTFWTDSPVSWFSVIEAQFRQKGVTDAIDRFYCVVAVLPQTVAKRVTAFINDPPQFNPYGRLKDLLTDAHTLTDYEKVEKINSWPSLGGQKPSDLLADLLGLCPEGEEETAWFRNAFLRRLPTTVRLHLLNNADGLRRIAVRADELVVHTASQHLAAVESSEATEDLTADSIAAVRPGTGSGGRGRGGHRGGRGGRGGHQQRQPHPHQQPQQPHQQPQQPTPQSLARKASGLCGFHFRYGAEAYNCVQPCSWQGN